MYKKNYIDTHKYINHLELVDIIKYPELFSEKEVDEANICIENIKNAIVWNCSIIYIIAMLEEGYKFLFTGRTKVVKNITVNQIVYLRDIEIPFGIIKAGTIGGWLQYIDNLSDDGNSVVLDNSVVIGIKSKVIDNAIIRNNSIVANSNISGNVIVEDYSYIKNESILTDNVRVNNYSKIDNSSLSDNVSCSNTKVCNRVIFGNKLVDGYKI